MSALPEPSRPALTVLEGGRGRPSKARLIQLTDAIEDARIELAARRTEELQMASHLFPLMMRAKAHARAMGPDAFKVIATIDYLLSRHAARWQDDPETAA